MFKLTAEQREEVLLSLDEMLCSTKKNKEKLSKLTDWYDESIDKYFNEGINDIENLIEKIKTDKDFQLSKDLLIMGLIHEMLSTKDKDTLCKLNMGFCGEEE